jgi:hypothetical protein
LLHQPDANLEQNCQHFYTTDFPVKLLAYGSPYYFQQTAVNKCNIGFTKTAILYVVARSANTDFKRLAVFQISMDFQITGFLTGVSYPCLERNGQSAKRYLSTT